MGFTRDQLESFRGAGVPDLLGPSVALLFVGINPGLWTAATQTHFCHPSNRFWPSMRLAGLIDWAVNPDTGMTEAQRADLVAKGIGITNLVNRGWVRREVAGDDGRGVLLVLTEAGETAAARQAGARRERLGAVLDRLPDDERATVVRALQTLAEASLDPS